LDDLNTPLVKPEPKRRLRLPVSASQALAGILGLSFAVFVGWAVAVDDPLGGEPVAIAAIGGRGVPSQGDAAKPEPGAPPRPDGAPGAASDSGAPPAGAKTVTIIDGSSGKRQEVVISGPPEKRAGPAGIDERLLEGTRHGRIPKVVAGGQRSIEAYASPLAAKQAALRGSRIAIVVGGLGVSAAGTADALARLPPAVSLAFVPYGGNLDDLAAQARDRGHEVLVQVPMEPFDYPDNDSGPQTLLTTMPTERNLDRLHWQMSRVQGYVGVMNFMGARFTATEKALAPVMEDIARRGLLYVDDGSSARSRAGTIAAAHHMPFAKADEVLDAVATPAEIDRALARLEAAAFKQGIAVGVATALPVSIDRIVRWAKGAEARGIILVPVTTAALKPRSS
jgi:uncharacterized protein